MSQRECPSPSAHRRLDEAHKSWHRALQTYHDPDDFRHELNNTIQTLRNLTFQLQKEKRLIPDFDNWYAGWQAKMKGDTLMRWLHEARTRIVHQGDLDTRSIARTRLITDYIAAAELAESGLPRRGDVQGEAIFRPAGSISDAINALQSQKIPDRVLRDSYVSIERRWVADDLPNYELLDALGHCHGFLLALVTDAHKITNSTHRITIEHGSDGESEEIPLPFGRLGCMVTSVEDRTTRFALNDGRLDIGGMSWSVEDTNMGESETLEAFRRYRPKPVKRNTIPLTVVDLLPAYVQMGIGILRSGEEHGWFVFFFRGRQVVHHRRFAAKDAIDKRIIAHEIAGFVAANRIDGIIEVAEVWRSPLSVDADNVPIPAAENPNRTESLVFFAFDAKGNEEVIEVSIERRRFRKRPILGEPVKLKSSMSFFFLPVRRVWESLGLSRPPEAETGESAASGEDGDPQS